MLNANMENVRKCCLAGRAWHDDKGDDLKLEAWQTWMDHTFPRVHDRNSAYGFIDALCENTNLSGESIYILARLIVEEVDDDLLEQ